MIEKLNKVSQAELDKTDFYAFCTEYDMDPPGILRNMESVTNIDNIGPKDPFHIACSARGGKGIISLSRIQAKTVIGAVQMCGKVLLTLGRYVNHSIAPNCKMVNFNHITFLTTLRDIKEGEELTTNYRENLKVLPVFTAKDNK